MASVVKSLRPLNALRQVARAPVLESLAAKDVKRPKAPMIFQGKHAQMKSASQITMKKMILLRNLLMQT